MLVPVLCSLRSLGLDRSFRHGRPEETISQGTRSPVPTQNFDTRDALLRSVHDLHSQLSDHVG